MSPTVRNGRGEREVYAVEPIGSPLGSVTRRVATDAERAGFASSVAGPGVIRLPRHAPIARAEDLTPAQRETVIALVNVERSDRGEPPIHVVVPETEAVTPSPEEPAMAIESTVTFPMAMTPSPIDELVDATEGLRRALERVQVTADELRAAQLRHEAASSARQDADEACSSAYSRLDAAYAGLARPPAEASIAERRHEQLINGDRPAIVESPSDHAETIPDEPGPTEEPADDALEVVTRPAEPDPTAQPAAAFAAFSRDRAAAAGGGPGPELPRGQREVLEAVLRHDGDRRAAAEELHRSLKTIETQLEYAGKKGFLPAELLAKLPARYAKYSPAAG